jgi:hypothetical protein
MTDKPASRDPILRALHEARKAQGLTLLDVAERMGRATPQSPWHWESGKNSPSLVNLHEWAGALGYELTLKPRATSRRSGCVALPRPVFTNPGWVCTGSDLVCVMRIKFCGADLPCVVPAQLLDQVMAKPWASAYDKPTPFDGLTDHMHLVVDP